MRAKHINGSGSIFHSNLGHALYLIARAYDGYSPALPLDYLLDNDILIAYKMNNVTLPAEREFPFQLVAESKYRYKWIK